MSSKFKLNFRSELKSNSLRNIFEALKYYLSLKEKKASLVENNP